MVRTREEAIDIVSQTLEEKEEAETIILYGSAVQDRLTEESDLDIAAASAGGLSNEYRRDLAFRLSNAAERHVSVLDLAKLEGLILREILSRGQLIRNHNPNHLAQFTIKMYDYVEDLMPLQMEGIKNYLRRSLHGQSGYSEEIESLNRCLNRIEEKRPDSLDELLRNYDLQDILSVNLERAVQISADISAVLLAERGAKSADSMGQGFLILADLGILPSGLAQNLKNAVGFRNISVHEYQEIDWEIVFDIIHNHLDNFRVFLRQILEL